MSLIRRVDRLISPSSTIESTTCSQSVSQEQKYDDMVYVMYSVLVLQERHTVKDNDVEGYTVILAVMSKSKYR